jgi:hypothetical protein
MKFFVQDHCRDMHCHPGSLHPLPQTPLQEHARWVLSGTIRLWPEIQEQRIPTQWIWEAVSA